MEIVGYADRLSVQQGEMVRFMVSCQQPRYRADIVRLIHGDENPNGPGFKEELIESSVNGEYPGREQLLHKGSYVIVPDSPSLRQVGSFTLQAWIYSTTPNKGVQGLLTKWSAADGVGYGLVIDEDGGLALWLSDDAGSVERVHSSNSLRALEWYFVAATYDAETGQVRLVQEPITGWPQDASRVAMARSSSIRGVREGDHAFLMAGYWEGTASDRLVGGHFNGKIDSPRLFGRALSQEELESLKGGASAKALGEALIAEWNFSADSSSTKVTDTSFHGLHGYTVNMPARAMTGHNWTGNEINYNRAPAEYGAIHFHDDDLDDAGWEVDFELSVPDQLKSGVYAARLKAGDGEDYIPFFVRPKKGTASARTVFLAPTFSYLAYANEHGVASPLMQILDPRGASASYPVQTQDKYIVEQGLSSLYDTHTDGSGVCYSSRLRPILNMRPKYNMPILSSPHQFNADLHLVEWLEAQAHPFDVVTDEDLHFEGEDLLTPYKVVLTGSHPEYWSEPMLEALESYLNNGGRLMYLGGNGFYWITSVDPERRHTVEVRRWRGTQSWAAAPGEGFHSTTGEMGGLWRFRGRAPQKMLGVGFTAQGLDRGAPFHRESGSFDPRAAFIFEGVGQDELIGDFDSLVLEFGAGGFELDRFDPALGSPPHALVLATSSGHTDYFQHVIEEVLYSNPREGGTTQPLVKADMVYFEYPNDGAVFSASSISWCGSLSYEGYENNVSRITGNVLKKFASDDPLP
jgi:N,N-dimethylformamidase